MKELFTDITLRNGEVKKIKVELEDELAEWLVTQGKRQDHSCFLYRRCGDYDFLCRRRTCAKRKRGLPEYHWQAV